MSVFGENLIKVDHWRSVEDYMSPIIPCYLDDHVSEIMINRFDNILVQRTDGIAKIESSFSDEAELKRFVTQIASALGQKFNEANPILDARFPDDSRICAVHDVISPKGINVTIRIARKSGGLVTPDVMISNNYMTPEMWHFLVNEYSNGKNIIFSGNTGSGKTTVMRNLIDSLGDQERILIVEDTNEINISHPNVVNMEAAAKRDVSVSMERLIQTTLRQFGSKLVVGEIRDGLAANALIQAINTGVDGCTASIHANGANAAVSRLQYLLCTLGYVKFELAKTLILSSIDIFVHCKRCNNHGRKITEIAVVNKSRDALDTAYFYDTLDECHKKSF